MTKIIKELKEKADAIHLELQEVKKVITETDDDRRRNESSYSKERSLSRKYWKIMDEIQHLDSYNANKELQKIVKKIIDFAEEDYDNFRFFENAEAKFTNYGNNGRQLHVDIVCSQVCDHDIKKVLLSAEKVTKRKIIDWFISASVGYNSLHDARAWLTYHLTFKGEKRNDKRKTGA